MRVLILGAGGREHALAWRIAQDPGVTEVLCAPGNPGMAALGRVVPLSINDAAAVAALVSAERVDLTVVGPEAPLDAGVSDALRAAGHRVIGPSRASAQLECSKAFAKRVMADRRIPTARFKVVDSLDDAFAAVAGPDFGFPVVVKADGLAAGKGVVVAQDRAEADAAVRSCLEARAFGEAGARVVIEDFLPGEEASFIVVARDRQYVAMATSQDHKRIFDGDQGPNTGGMGAYSPAPVVTQEVHARVCREVIEPTLAGMMSEGNPFCGFLYAGLMIDPKGGIKVLEFNTRMGDPETQPILFRLESDLVELLDAALDRRLDASKVRWSPNPALGVVLAAGGYPGDVRKGDVIRGLDADLGGAKVFHAGTAQKDGGVVTSGGRVLCVVGSGPDVAAAQKAAYAGVAKIDWDGMQFRRDIGYRAIGR
jgi:phosphoribosylamine--glycine ligase